MVAHRLRPSWSQHVVLGKPSRSRRTTRCAFLPQERGGRQRARRPQKEGDCSPSALPSGARAEQWNMLSGNHTEQHISPPNSRVSSWAQRITGVSALGLGLEAALHAGAGVHHLGLADDEAVLDQLLFDSAAQSTEQNGSATAAAAAPPPRGPPAPYLADVLPGVGEGDLVDLVGVEPHLALSALEHGGRQPSHRTASSTRVSHPPHTRIPALRSSRRRRFSPLLKLERDLQRRAQTRPLARAADADFEAGKRRGRSAPSAARMRGCPARSCSGDVPFFLPVLVKVPGVMAIHHKATRGVPPVRQRHPPQPGKIP